MAQTQTEISTIRSTQLQPQSTSPPIPNTDHLKGVAYLFGYPIAHSLSPTLHSTIYNALSLPNEQFLYETKSLPDCLALCRTPKFYGASVTMPHKVAIIPHLDMLTPEAEAIGAVNTIFLRNSPAGKRLLCGTNTDCIGIREAITQNTPKEEVATWEGKVGMVIGGGGTCRAAVYALKHYLGVERVLMVNRDRSEVEQVIAECESKGFGEGLQYVESVEEAKTLEAPCVIVSAIPDFEPKSVDEVRARGIIEVLLGKGEKKGTILEMCYHPSPDTAVARIAKKEGWRVVEGVEAMIWQGLEQDKVWLRRRVSTLPVEKVKEVIRERIRSHL